MVTCLSSSVHSCCVGPGGYLGTRQFCQLINGRSIKEATHGGAVSRDGCVSFAEAGSPNFLFLLVSMLSGSAVAPLLEETAGGRGKTLIQV
jgi:hypothetical protein